MENKKQEKQSLTGDEDSQSSTEREMQGKIHEIDPTLVDLPKASRGNALSRSAFEVNNSNQNGQAKQDNSVNKGKVRRRRKAKDVAVAISTEKEAYPRHAKEGTQEGAQKSQNARGEIVLRFEGEESGNEDISDDPQIDFPQSDYDQGVYTQETSEAPSTNLAENEVVKGEGEKGEGEKVYKGESEDEAQMDLFEDRSEIILDGHYQGKVQVGGESVIPPSESEPEGSPDLESKPEPKPEPEPLSIEQAKDLLDEETISEVVADPSEGETVSICAADLKKLLAEREELEKERKQWIIDREKISTYRHIDRVEHYLHRMIKHLIKRAELHDRSKLDEPEAALFAEQGHRLKDLEYGSEEYQESLDALRPALEHHYAQNRHHPQHFENGVADMNIVDVLEMFCDWKSSSERQNGGNLRKSLEENAERFGMPPMLVSILKNSIDLLTE